MRGLIIALITLTAVSSTAQAGPSRSLSLAAYEPPQGQTVQTSTERKADVPTAPKPDEQETVKAPASAPAAEVIKPVKRRMSTESRVILELHRHGIYW